MPARLWPFSLAEFRALVSAALKSDAPATALSLSLSGAAPPSISFISNFQRKKSLPNLPHAPPDRKAQEACRSCYYKAPVGVRAPAVVGEPDRSRSSADSLSPFTRYLSLAVQYECAPSESVFFAPSPSPTSYESACTSDSSHSHAPPQPSPTASSFSDASASFILIRLSPRRRWGTPPRRIHSLKTLCASSIVLARRCGYAGVRRIICLIPPRCPHREREEAGGEYSVWRWRRSWTTLVFICRRRRSRRSYADREEGKEEWKLPTPPPSPSHTTPVSAPASLTRAPTARSYPLSPAPCLRRTKRPGSPFPLPLMRGATSA
ncbi:hypothetical protein B0H19DRAFT_1066017 [Mycena capillaripes]|nr:hypothetical protein B0H19DRAFT_1066017 [Mycena capillaripes]